MNTDFFEPILLEEMDRVTLMNRTDTKFCFHIDQLEELLKSVKDHYFLLHIDGKGALPYHTTYFDTKADHMFSAHHNGKLNRYKIRRRTYLTSDKSFMEIKFKSNKGRTIKQRISTENKKEDISFEESVFLSENSPYGSKALKPVLVNKFNRLMLVSKTFDERCTIDINLEFHNYTYITEVSDLVIVEVKAEGHSKTSPLMKALQERRIKVSGLSKYCIGRSLTAPKLKSNLFTSKLRKIKKIVLNDIKLQSK